MRRLTNTIKHNWKHLSVGGAATVAVAALGIGAYLIWLNTRIATEREILGAEAEVRVETSALRAPAGDGMALFTSAAECRAVASFEGVTYLATGGGLAALDSSNSVKRLYTSMDGLPDVDLTSLAVFDNRLWIGTATEGLVSFDGTAFTHHRLVKPKATRISVLAATEGELLVGTLDGGLFEHDGQRFRRRINSATGADFRRVTVLLPYESRLYIGTQDQGLYIWREARIEHLGTGEGLPSPRVTGLTPLPSDLSEAGSIALATDFGVIGLDDDNQIKPLADRPNITSLAISGGRLWAGLFSGGVVEVKLDSVSLQSLGLPESSPTTLWSLDEVLWALTSHGAFAGTIASSRLRFESVASALASAEALTANHVTSLALDWMGRLWIGYFDRGIDVIDPASGERLWRVEDEHIREVNFLRFEPDSDRMMVATSRGLVFVNPQSKKTVLTSEQHGIADNAVAHVALAQASLWSRKPGKALVVATASGLSEIADGRARTITAFHGLPSNHLYTSASVAGRLYAGSLAGLVELEGARVVRTHKTSNSRLSHDWVTALAEAEGTLYIGTNGGGVDALLPTGEWINFSDELGRFEVNQNAMHVDGESLYVGTTDRGLLVYNTRGRTWTRIGAGLPSQSVTSVTSDDQFIYAGTLNGLVRVEKRRAD
jgi:ligand-binding sensor domain-containing protein